MAARKHTVEEIQNLRVKIYDFHLKGYNQREIAAALGLTQQVVSYHRGELQAEADRRWEQTVEQLVFQRQQEIEAVRLVRREFWQSTERLKKLRPKSVADQVKIEGAISKNMQGLLKSGDSIAKLLGLYDTNSLLASDVNEAPTEYNEEEMVQLLDEIAQKEIEPTLLPDDEMTNDATTNEEVTDDEMTSDEVTRESETAKQSQSRKKPKSTKA